MKKRGLSHVATLKAKYMLMLATALLYFIFALIWSTPQEIINGLINIMLNPSVLVTDYIAVGGIGATLTNSAIMIILQILIIRATGAELDGAHMAAAYMISGFAFFGTNPLNAWPIAMGAMLFALWQKIPLNSVLLQGFYASALGPLVSVLMFDLHWPLYYSIPLGLITGLAVGFLTPPLATAFLNFHRGYSLYNIGFVAGVLGMLGVAVLRLFDHEIDKIAVLSTNEGTHLTYVFASLFISILILGIYMNHGHFRGYTYLLRNSGKLITDFDILYGSGLTFINMGLMGLIALTYVYLFNLPLNGPIIGGILSVMGFAAMGKHPRNTLPIMLGVFLATVVSPVAHNDTTAIMTALFATALAPIAGEFGPLPGVIAGFFHTALVRNVIDVHGGVDLYNNGFAAGFVAAVMLPLLEFVEKKRQAKIYSEVLWRNRNPKS